jgi:hypothetical protein
MLLKFILLSPPKQNAFFNRDIIRGDALPHNGKNDEL